MSPQDALSTVKALLGPSDQDEALLSTIIQLTTDRLKNLLGVSEVPEELAWIIPEVSVARFNRIGSEGVKTHTIGGESMAFSSGGDFDAYAEDIQAWKDKQDHGGMVVFL